MQFTLYRSKIIIFYITCFLSQVQSIYTTGNEFQFKFLIIYYLIGTEKVDGVQVSHISPYPENTGT